MVKHSPIERGAEYLLYSEIKIFIVFDAENKLKLMRSSDKKMKFHGFKIGETIKNPEKLGTIVNKYPEAIALKIKENIYRTK